MHYSVLLNESIQLLNINPNGVYLDGTFGRGGHSQEILAKLSPSGKLIAFDKDPEAINYADKFKSDNRFQICHASFASAEKIIKSNFAGQVDGVLLDLGISSPQVDNPERGFSFRYEAPLDMRMDNSSGLSAADFINSASEEELIKVFWEYGEEKFSRKIAKAIVNDRQSKPIETTLELAGLIERLIGRREVNKHPATRVFQAIRIHVNNELGDLIEFLDSVPQLLKLGGRIVIISFHSLEDRIVKNKFNQLASVKELPKWVMANPEESEYKVIAKKIKATEKELAENARSRSAVMRCLERVSVKNN